MTRRSSSTRNIKAFYGSAVCFCVCLSSKLYTIYICASVDCMVCICECAVLERICAKVHSRTQSARTHTGLSLYYADRFEDASEQFVRVCPFHHTRKHAHTRIPWHTHEHTTTHQLTLTQAPTTLFSDPSICIYVCMYSRIHVYMYTCILRGCGFKPPRYRGGCLGPSISGALNLNPTPNPYNRNPQNKNTKS